MSAFCMSHCQLIDALRIASRRCPPPMIGSDALHFHHMLGLVDMRLPTFRIVRLGGFIQHIRGFRCYSH
jgi:hypothetical protein